MRRKDGNSIDPSQEIYAFAHVETWLEDYAKSQRLPAHELTVRVAALLFSQTGGSVLGTQDRVPDLRGKAAKRSKAVEPVEVVKRSYGKTRTLSAASRKRIGAAKRAWWKTYRRKKAWREKTKQKPSPAQVRAREANLVKVRAARLANLQRAA